MYGFTVFITIHYSLFTAFFPFSLHTLVATSSIVKNIENLSSFFNAYTLITYHLIVS